MKVRYNGVSQLNLNSLISLAGIIFLAGGGWFKLNLMQEEYKTQSARLSYVMEQLSTLESKVAQLEQAVSRQQHSSAPRKKHRWGRP